MTRIIIEPIPHQFQRYDTTGDWYFDAAGDLVIKVSGVDAIDQDEVFLVALHELVEAKLCHRAGITQGAVDHFDLSWSGEGEPGDSPDAPYMQQHRKAMLIEHLMADFLGLCRYGSVE